MGVERGIISEREGEGARESESERSREGERERERYCGIMQMIKLWNNVIMEVKTGEK